MYLVPRNIPFCGISNILGNTFEITDCSDISKSVLEHLINSEVYLIKKTHPLRPNIIFVEIYKMLHEYKLQRDNRKEKEEEEERSR